MKDKPSKPKRTNGDKLEIRIHDFWKHRSRETREGLRALWFATWATFALILFLFGLGFAVELNLVQIPTVLSFGLVELFAFFLARAFLNERRDRRSVMELMAVIDNLPKYSHLEIHFVNIGIRDTYPTRPEYVVNTISKRAFYVSPPIRELARAGAIQKIEHDTEEELWDYLENNVEVFGRPPRAFDLELIDPLPKES